MSTIDLTARWLAFALRPLAVATSAPDADSIRFVEELGWTLPSVPPGWRALAASTGGALDSLSSVLDTWQRHAEGDASDADLELQSAALIASVALFADAVKALPDRFRAELPSNFLAATGIADAIETRLLAWLSDRFLAAQLPLARNLLVLIGIIETTSQSANPTRFQPAFTLVTFRWDRLSLALTNPAQLLHDVYGWGTPTLDATRLFDALLPLSFFLAAPAEIHCPTTGFVSALVPNVGPISYAMLSSELWIPILASDVAGAFLVLTPLPAAAGDAQPLGATVVLRGSVADSIPLTPWITLELAGSAQIGSGLAAVLLPGAAPRVIADASGVGGSMTSGEVRLGVRIAKPRQHAPALVVSDGTWLDIGQVELAIALDGGASPDVAVELTLGKTQLVVSADPSDGFLSSVVPRDGLVASADATLRWSASHGIQLQGGGGLTVTLPINASAGPFTLTEFDAHIDPAGDGISLRTSLSGSVSIGPVTVGVQHLGLEAVVGFHTGNLGAADLTMQLAPPDGASIGIAAGPVFGGGALTYDQAKGLYAGWLALQIFDVGAQAFGLIDTRPPGGGYSLVVAVSTTFPSIPLGLGFTLTGLGGLVALNRSAAVDALQAATRSGALGQILFPSDPSTHAASLVSGLATYFPAAHGRHIVGPAAQLGWGTPSVLQAKLALLLELPAPVQIVLLGDIQLGLPNLDHRFVDIRIAVLGVVDLDRKSLAIDASLHDSKLAGYPLTGDMALRLAWGDAPQFLFSVGGFHPHFTPPPGFPTLRRLALTAGDNPQLRMSCYLALTSNTAQVGAQADLTASGGGFDIKAHVGFDALFEFVPFHFEVEITASASISWHGHNLLGVDLDFLLTGPHPWHAKGDASFGILWWSVSVGFDVTWGDATPAPLPPPPDIASALRDALGRADAWSGELPAGELAWVAFGNSAADTTTVHPFAALVVRERAVPLDYDVTEFGNIPLAASQRFAIASTVQVGTTAAATNTVSDEFAPGQFTQLTSDQKLAAPSFEAFHSGVRIDSGASPGSDARAPMDTETIVDDPFAPPPATMSPVVLPSTFATLAGVVRPAGRPPVPPRGGPRFGDLAYTLASADDLSITAAGAAIGRGATTYAGLREALRLSPPSGAAPLQVVPRIQVANANARVVVVREDERMRNLDFVDTLTGRAMTRAEFVDAINAGNYSDYLVRHINGVPTPVSRPNATTADNLG